jgi:hypothetical protein
VRILDDATGAVMQAAMGDRLGEKGHGASFGWLHGAASRAP